MLISVAARGIKGKTKGKTLRKVYWSYRDGENAPGGATFFFKLQDFWRVLYSFSKLRISLSPSSSIVRSSTIWMMHCSQRSRFTFCKVILRLSQNIGTGVWSRNVRIICEFFLPKAREARIAASVWSKLPAKWAGAQKYRKLTSEFAKYDNLWGFWFKNHVLEFQFCGIYEYDEVSDVAKSWVRFARENLTHCKMH